MITPKFSCTQTESTVSVAIYCPSVRASELDISVDRAQLTVHIPPYFLRLTFPGALSNPEDTPDPRDDDPSGAKYDPSAGSLTLTLLKAVPGEHFPDLDLLPRLLAPQQPKPAPTIEVLDSADSKDAADAELARRMDSLDLEAERREILQAAENDWRLPPQPTLHTSARRPYGFLDAHSGYFLQRADNELLASELGGDTDIETMDSTERRARRLRHEEAKWDPEYYMADYADDSYIKELLHWTHPHLHPDASADVEYTDAEKLAMLNLPKKEYLATPAQAAALLHTLATLLFGYFYDARTTQHDPTPESAWTIAALVPACAALDPAPYDPSGTVAAAPDLAATLATSYRRAFAYPLYRSWALAEKCKDDVARCLVKGKRTTLRILLEMKHIFDMHEAHYVFSKLWVDDFLVWLALQPDDTVRALGAAIAGVRMCKDTIGWDLETLEDSVDTREADSDDEDEDEDEDEVERMLPAPL